jgi:hypothetical protein
VTYGISGGLIERFREGWAIIPFIRKPHFYRRVELTRRYLTLCGIVRDLNDSHPGIKPLGPGEFMVDRCKSCSKKHQRVKR